MLASLVRRSQPVKQARAAAAATVWPLLQWLAGPGDGSRPLASVAAGGATPAASAAAAAGTPWQQHFEVAPGSILRVDLGQAAADLTVKVGEHEGIQLSSSCPLLAEQAPHFERAGSTVGACEPCREVEQVAWLDHYNSWNDHHMHPLSLLGFPACSVGQPGPNRGSTISAGSGCSGGPAAAAGAGALSLSVTGSDHWRRQRSSGGHSRGQPASEYWRRRHLGPQGGWEARGGARRVAGRAEARKTKGR